MWVLEVRLEPIFVLHADTSPIQITRNGRIYDLQQTVAEFWHQRHIHKGVKAVHKPQLHFGRYVKCIVVVIRVCGSLVVIESVTVKQDPCCACFHQEIGLDTYRKKQFQSFLTYGKPEHDRNTQVVEIIDEPCVRRNAAATTVDKPVARIDHIAIGQRVFSGLIT